MFVGVETFTPAAQRLLDHLRDMTDHVPLAASPLFVYHSRSRHDGLLRHPVMSSLQQPVEYSSLVELLGHGLITIGIDDNDQTLVWLDQLGLEMHEPVQNSLEPPRAVAY